MGDIVTSTPIIVLPKRKTLGKDTTYPTPLKPQTNFQNLVVGTAKITTAMIVDLAVNNAKISDLAAAKITGQIVNAQIANIAFAKITDVQVTNAQIVSLDAGKITSQIVDAQLASIAFAKITNVIIQDAHIVSLSVAKITAGNLSAVITLTGSIAVTGSITGASGNVLINATGLTIKGSNALFLHNPIYDLTQKMWLENTGWIEADTGFEGRGFRVSGGYISTLYSIIPYNATSLLGSSSANQQWQYIFGCPVLTDSPGTSYNGAVHPYLADYPTTGRIAIRKGGAWRDNA